VTGVTFLSGSCPSARPHPVDRGTFLRIPERTTRTRSSPAMHLDYTPEQLALRDELRAYLDELITPELLAELDESEGGGPLYHKALQKMGADGWLGIGWPKEYGGQERGPIEQFIFFDEVQRA